MRLGRPHGRCEIGPNRMRLWVTWLRRPCECCRAKPNAPWRAASRRTESGYRSSLRCVLRRCQGFSYRRAGRPRAVRTRAFVRPSVRPLVRSFVRSFVLSSIHVHPVRPSVRPCGKNSVALAFFPCPTSLRDRVLPLAKMRPRETHAPWKPLAVSRRQTCDH